MSDNVWSERYATLKHYAATYGVGVQERCVKRKSMGSNAVNGACDFPTDTYGHPYIRMELPFGTHSWFGERESHYWILAHELSHAVQMKRDKVGWFEYGGNPLKFESEAWLMAFEYSRILFGIKPSSGVVNVILNGLTTHVMVHGKDSESWWYFKRGRFME